MGAHVPTLSLPKIRAPESIGKIGKAKKPPQPARIKTEPPTADMNDREKRAYYNSCGDPEERRDIILRFRSLIEKYPAITYPEAITYYLLEKRKVEFDFQVSQEGGRTELGGLVADFIVDYGGIGLALQVHGNYWHNKPEVRERDILYNERIIGQNVNGIIINEVVELWEDSLMGCRREEAMDKALLGIGVGEGY